MWCCPKISPKNCLKQDSLHSKSGEALESNNPEDGFIMKSTSQNPKSCCSVDPKVQTQTQASHQQVLFNLLMNTGDLYKRFYFYVFYLALWSIMVVTVGQKVLIKVQIKKNQCLILSSPKSWICSWQTAKSIE